MKLLRYNVHLRSAEDLEAKDLNGKSDPYCIVQINEQEVFRTHIIPNTLNPVWDTHYCHTQEVKSVENSELPMITFTLMDKDVLSDDFLGYCEVPAASLVIGSVFTETLVLERVTKGKLSLSIEPIVYDIDAMNREIRILRNDLMSTQDELIRVREDLVQQHQIAMDLEAKYSELERKKRASGDEVEQQFNQQYDVQVNESNSNVAATVYKLSIEVAEARDLITEDVFSRSSDPYVKVILGDVVKETQVIKSTLNPVWNENMGNFYVEDLDSDVVVQVFDWDRIGRHDPLGHARVHLARLFDNFKGNSFGISLPLEGVKSGTVDLRITYETFSNQK